MWKGTALGGLEGRCGFWRGVEIEGKLFASLGALILTCAGTRAFRTWRLSFQEGESRQSQLHGKVCLVGIEICLIEEEGRRRETSSVRVFPFHLHQPFILSPVLTLSEVRGDTVGETRRAQWFWTD